MRGVGLYCQGKGVERFQILQSDPRFERVRAPKHLRRIRTVHTRRVRAVPEMGARVADGDDEPSYRRSRPRVSRTRGVSATHEPRARRAESDDKPESTLKAKPPSTLTAKRPSTVKAKPPSTYSDSSEHPTSTAPKTLRHGNLPSAVSSSSRARRSVSSATAMAVSASRARRCASITSMLVAAPARKLMLTMSTTC